MLATAKRIADLTAADVMSRDVVVIPLNMDLRTAARLLSEARVSGAPVIDASGRCIGVVSTTDFVHWAEDIRRESCQEPGCICSDWQVVRPASLPADAVATYMTPDPVMAASTVTVPELARMMLDAHIHRVIVVDQDDRPIGIVSSTDILAAVAS
jgi:CBS-domain-containing membrane protein